MFFSFCAYSWKNADNSSDISFFRTNEVTDFIKGSKTDVQNYRPFILLNIESKVLEKIMYDTILRCFIEFCSDRQHGFRPGRSPVLRIFRALSKNYDSWSHKTISLILFDFQKGFDSIDQEILLKKLAQIGLHQSFFDLLRSYLTGRSQSVTFEDITSEVVNVRAGVPHNPLFEQGSILGPPLFLIFVNDLPSNVLIATAYMFADDLTALNIGSKGDLCKFQEDISRIQN